MSLQIVPTLGGQDLVVNSCSTFYVAVLVKVNSELVDTVLRMNREPGSINDVGLIVLPRTAQTGVINEKVDSQELC